MAAAQGQVFPDVPCAERRDPYRTRRKLSKGAPVPVPRTPPPVSNALRPRRAFLVLSGQVDGVSAASSLAVSYMAIPQSLDILRTDISSAPDTAAHSDLCNACLSCHGLSLSLATLRGPALWKRFCPAQSLSERFRLPSFLELPACARIQTLAQISACET